MCGRVFNALDAAEIRRECRALCFYDAERFRPKSFNIGPTRYLPVMVGTHNMEQVTQVVRAEVSQRESWATDSAPLTIQADDEEKHKLGKEEKLVRYVRCMRWGIVPHYTKSMPDYTETRNTINARDDTILSGKGMWQGLKNQKRAVIPVQGFYEWQKLTDKDKMPHVVQMLEKDGKRPIMLLAGLWDKAQIDDNGKKVVLNSFTIITTHPCKQLEFLHDRMPVILDELDVDKWLDPELPFDKVSNLLRPYTSPLDCTPVTSYVGNVKNDGPECIRPATQEEIQLMKAGKKVKLEPGQLSITSFFAKSPSPSPRKRKRE